MRGGRDIAAKCKRELRARDEEHNACLMDLRVTIESEKRALEDELAEAFHAQMSSSSRQREKGRGNCGASARIAICGSGDREPPLA
jgi:hypothetical protein